MTAARDLYQNGDLAGASSRLQAAGSLKPKDAAVRLLANDVDAAIKQEQSDLLAALDAFYRGDYAKAREKLNGFVSRQHSPRVLALARFYLGAVSASEYLLNGRNPDKKEWPLLSPSRVILVSLPTGNLCRLKSGPYSVKLPGYSVDPHVHGGSMRKVVLIKSTLVLVAAALITTSMWLPSAMTATQQNTTPAKPAVAGRPLNTLTEQDLFKKADADYAPGSSKMHVRT